MYLIEIRETERDYIEVMKDLPDIKSFRLTPGKGVARQTVDIERIYGQRFRSNDLEYCIGMTEEAQEILGIPFESFYSMSNLIAADAELIVTLKKNITALTKFKDEVLSMSFLARLKFLIKGEKP